MLLLTGCSDGPENDEVISNGKKTAVVAAKKTPASASPIRIIIQPFTDLPQTDVQFVYDELKKVYPEVQLHKSIPLPAFACYKPRHRYKADSLIEHLQTMTGSNEVIIGLTSKDISTTKAQHADWGVMGLGLCPGNACVASTFRVSKTETSLQLFKVAIHELGHTQGLPHCEVKTCFMRDAEGGNPTEEEKEFCTKCRKVLEGKGWKF